MKGKRGYKRGYPVAVLVSLEEDHAVLWHVFSHVAKLHVTLKLNGKRTDKKALYHFHEAVIAMLRPSLQEGVRSIVVAAPAKTTYTTDFLNHVHGHHAYLLQPRNPNRATFAELVGSADQVSKVTALVKTREFRRIVSEATTEEAENMVRILEEHLADRNAVVLLSLEEIEYMLYHRLEKNDVAAKYLMLTDKYIFDQKQKNRINTMLQVSKNKQVKTTIIKSDTPAGKRVDQFGGIVFFIQST